MVSSYLRVLRELVVATHGSWSRGGGVVVVVVSPRSVVSRASPRHRSLEESVVITQQKLEIKTSSSWCWSSSVSSSVVVRDIEYTRASMNALFSSSSSSLPIARRVCERDKRERHPRLFDDAR